MSRYSHYPEFNVMDSQDSWDDHTRSIVASRLVREQGYRFIELVEAEVLRAICSTLADEQRGEIIQYAVNHIDETLAAAKGEGQRKANVPAGDKLIRDGIKALQLTSMERHGKPFFGLTMDERKLLLQELSNNNVQPAGPWQQLPQPEFFNKLLKMTIEAVYSHPDVWSEIGYAGPAYPRGYVRTGIGQLDPWEPRNVHEKA